MSDEPKVFTKTQLIEKLTEVAKKQKEKNDLVLKEQETKFNELSDTYNQLYQKSEKFAEIEKTYKQTIDDLNLKITELTNSINELTVKNQELVEKQVDNKVNDADIRYQEFYKTVKELADKFSNDSEFVVPTEENPVETTEEKPKRKRKAVKVEEPKEPKETEVKEGTQETAPVEQPVETKQEEETIDVDALLSEL